MKEDKLPGKMSNLTISQQKGIKGFPEVAVDQTNVRISDIIRRNLAGEQVLGTTKLAYDYLGTEQFTSMDVNPFNTMDFDLDDSIRLADKVGATISDLTSEQTKINSQLKDKLSELTKQKQVDQGSQVEKLEQAKESISK